MGLFDIPRNGPEVSDAIVSFNSETLEREPVIKSEVLREFAVLGNQQAARIVGRIPERDGALDPNAVDRLLVTAHCD
ncbi:MAG TPA: hypothetical protein VF666_10955 [Pyrinomonadaceae bacterium]|jgi:hypothetical protein